MVKKTGHVGQKPVDVRAKKAKGKPYGRQAVWEALRQHGRGEAWVSLDRMVVECQQNRRTIKDYLDALTLAGFAESRVEGEFVRRKFYRLIKDVGHQAPRVNKEGKMVVTARDHMWRCMKMLDHFNPDDLAAASTTEDCTVVSTDANKYCLSLHKAGYLLVVQTATTQRKAVYKLRNSMKTGPHAPMIQRTKVVFDPNLQRVMWHEDMEP